jgi:hypothetical protein
MPTAVAITVDIPFIWKAGPVPAVTDGVLLLRVLSMLEATPPHFDEDESPEALRWQAMEARLDLCVQMLGQLLARGDLPSRHCEVKLSGERCSWSSAQAVAIGEAGAVGLNLSPRIPQILWLPATIAECTPQGDVWSIAAQLTISDSELQDWLDKTIFRHHRREIYERKRHALDDDPAT